MSKISCIAISCDHFDGKDYSAEDALCPECRAHEDRMAQKQYHVCYQDEEGDTIYRGQNGAVWCWRKEHAGKWDCDKANELMFAAEAASEDDPRGAPSYWIEEAA